MGQVPNLAKLTAANINAALRGEPIIETTESSQRSFLEIIKHTTQQIPIIPITKHIHFEYSESLVDVEQDIVKNSEITNEELKKLIISDPCILHSLTCYQLCNHIEEIYKIRSVFTTLKGISDETFNFIRQHSGSMTFVENLNKIIVELTKFEYQNLGFYYEKSLPLQKLREILGVIEIQT